MVGVPAVPIALPAKRECRSILYEWCARRKPHSERRIIAYQSLYVVGALLSVFSTDLSVGFTIAVQLRAAIAPRVWRLDRF